MVCRRRDGTADLNRVVMCIILLAIESHPRYKLVFAANRDEYYDRPSEQACFRPEAPGLLAGKDGREGGIWTGVTKSGKIGALTNYRDPASNRLGAPSRGLLVQRFLLGPRAPEDYLRSILEKGCEYNGFNLLVGNLSELYWASNRHPEVCKLGPGVHGLSNRLLNTSWPKVARGKAMLAGVLSSRRGQLVERLLAILADRTVPPDGELPDTGVGLEWERILSPVFIESPIYGTRSSTVILIDRENHVSFVERTYDRSLNVAPDVRVDFAVETSSDMNLS